MLSLTTLSRKISTSLVLKKQNFPSVYQINLPKKSYPLYRMGYNLNITKNPKYKEIVICVKDYSTIYYKFVKIEVK
jgi:hypothetical protein